MIVPCACCGGDSVVVHEIGYDRTTGAIMEMIERCPECDGTGCAWIDGEPLDEDDVEACWPAEARAAVGIEPVEEPLQ